MSNDLPDGWTSVLLGELFNFKYGKGLPHEKRNGTGSIKVYGSNGVVGLHDRSVTKGPAIIVGRKGSVGEIHLSDEECWPIDTTYFIDEFVGLPPGYWAFFFKSLRLGQQEKSSAIPGISRSDIYQVEVPLPPLAEQWRIVSKLGVLLAKLQDSQKRLENIPRTLKRFREAILNAAVTGKLTINWRNKNGEMGTAAAELKSFGTALVARSFHTRELESTEGNEVLIDKVPVEWVTPSLEDLFRFIDYRGRTPKKARSGKRLISAKNIKMGYISEEPVEYVSNEFYKTWMTRGIPKKGDIFFVTEGHTMGFTALNNRTDEFALSQRTITLQPWQPIETTCFFYFIMSPIFQELVRLNATGSAAVGIKAARFRGLPIPFPSRAERQEIVRRVQSLFALADQIEARYSKVKAQVDRLTHPILSKAFQGELVRTEAELAAAEGRDYESAEELLKRIAYQRDSAVGSLTQSTRRSAIKEWLR
jgi:type I restriction enzyme S subunit